MTKAISETRNDGSLRRKLKNALRKIKEAAIKIDEWTELKSTQSEVAVGLGLRLQKESEKLIVPVEVEGTKYNAHLIVPEEGEKWDIEELTDYLHEAGLYGLYTSTVFDPEKWEKAVASGQVPKTLANKYRVKTKPASAHFRFLKA